MANRLTTINSHPQISPSTKIRRQPFGCKTDIPYIKKVWANTPADQREKPYLPPFPIHLRPAQRRGAQHTGFQHITRGHLLACKRWPLAVQDTAFRYAVCLLSQLVRISGAWPFLCFSNPKLLCLKCAWLFWETKKACHERHAFYDCNPTRRGITAESRTFLAAWLSL